MVKLWQNQFEPDYASPPGETLAEVLGALGMSQSEFAERTGRPKKTINEIVRGKEPITPNTALQFEKVLGVPASFWNNLENNYQETRARIKERDRLDGQADWLKKIPLRAMIQLGWLPSARDPVQQLRETLKFFGVASPEIWEHTQLSFRKSLSRACDPYSAAAWLRQGEIIAGKIQCSPYDRESFGAALSQIRRFTTQTPRSFQPRLIELCARSGVAVAFIPELPKLRISGVTRWLSPSKALIQLSLFYKQDDQLWFTFFHEAGHILLHGKRDLVMEGEGRRRDDTDEKEAAANRFAQNFLIPPSEYRPFIQKWNRSKSGIKAFARQLGIASGIVVGRLQHEGILPYTHCNDLKIRLKWDDNP